MYFSEFQNKLKNQGDNRIYEKKTQYYKSLKNCDRIQERLRKKEEIIFEKRTKLQIAQGLINTAAKRKHK